MTEVAFHFNAPDKLAYACRFARKAVRRDMRVVITGSEQDLRQLDRMLWAMAPTDFVAHCLTRRTRSSGRHRRCRWRAPPMTCASAGTARCC